MQQIENFFFKRLLPRLQVMALALLLTFAGVDRCQAQVNESQVKSAFLYKFISYVDWPPQTFQNPDSALIIGVMGADVIAENLAQLISSRTVAGRPIIVRKLLLGDSLLGLHMIFIGGAENSHLSDILATTKGKVLLIVTESESGKALALGSVINFVLVEDKVRFDVAPPPSDPNNLKVSARLLTVARRVVAGGS